MNLTNFASRWPSFQFVPLKSLLLLCTLVGLAIYPLPASASLVFDFVEEGTGDVLAIVQLAEPAPFDHTGILSFEFTAAADVIFGTGVGVFAVPFSRTPNAAFTNTLDAVGGLTSVNNVGSFTETGSAEFLGGLGLDNVTLTFNLNGSTSIPRDVLSVRVDGVGGFRTGDFLPHAAVPEPSLLSIWSMLGVCALATGRRRPSSFVTPNS